MSRDGETTLTKKANTIALSDVPSRSGVHVMFDRISPRYDLLNHLLSLGLDYSWRRRAVSKLGVGSNQTVLDLACGTGDLLLAARKRIDDGNRLIGLDKAPQMLSRAAMKIAHRNVASTKLILGDGMALPLADGTVDATMIAFGIRNMPDTVGCLQEMCRILKPGGKAIVLEFSLPHNRVLRALHRFYLRTFVPFLGRVVSGDVHAYRYLDRTIETFAQGKEFCRLMQMAGFTEVEAEALSFGIVTIYTGWRP